MKKVLLTGCAGFIGANFVKKIALRPEVKEGHQFVILDALTYAGFYPSIQKEVEEHEHLSFVHLNLLEKEKVEALFEREKFDGVIHFAAESHVDRSISGPSVFVDTNVSGSLNLLEASKKYCLEKKDFRYIQISTDEVYGSLKREDAAFTEKNLIAPNSPYSASKASGDLLARAYFETYGLPVLVTRCSNNYGPYQFPEKLIPLMVDKALQEQSLPVYGKGDNIRDWIHVDDHNEGVWQVFLRGRPGEVYNLGGDSERVNLDIVKQILHYLGKSEGLISFVPDRLGHDFRYAMDFSKIENELGWRPQITFEKGLEMTVAWYVENRQWVEAVKGR